MMENSNVLYQLSKNEIVHPKLLTSKHCRDWGNAQMKYSERILRKCRIWLTQNLLNNSLSCSEHEIKIPASLVVSLEQGSWYVLEFWCHIRLQLGFNLQDTYYQQTCIANYQIEEIHQYTWLIYFMKYSIFGYLLKSNWSNFRVHATLITSSRSREIIRISYMSLVNTLLIKQLDKKTCTVFNICWNMHIPNSVSYT